MHWYAVRVTYSRELFFKDYLDAEGIENYIPMRYEYVVRKERRLRKLVPAVHNLVFVRSTRERMDEIKNEPGMNIPIRYIMDRETRQPIVIPDSQMRSFIAVSGTYDQAVLYLEPTWQEGGGEHRGGDGGGDDVCACVVGGGDRRGMTGEGIFSYENILTYRNHVKMILDNILWR